jgi:hypothetical protein
VAAVISRRLIVLGAGGFFGSVATGCLQAEGFTPVRSSRRPGVFELQVDGNDAESIRSSLRPGDIVLDAAGPFQSRTTALVTAATEVGFDVVDLSDSFAYAARIVAMRDRIGRSGVRILTSCSAVSAVSAALVRLSGVAQPARVSVFLAPASRATANPATIRSFLASVGKPVTVRRDARLVPQAGWRVSRPFAWPGRGSTRGFLTESADALLLPEVWPSLRDVDFWVDTQVPLLNALLQASARIAIGAGVIRALSGVGSALARHLGAAAGAFAVEVEGQDGSVVRRILSGKARSYLIAVAPAVIAVRALAGGRLPETGLVPVNRQVDPDELVTYLAAAGIEDG